MANAFPHLSEITSELHPLEKDMENLLLIGRDIGEAHHVLEQRIGPLHSPYAQRIGFGWVVIGDVCLGRTHRPDTVVANKVTVLPNGRTALCDPCPSNIVIKENLPVRKHYDEYLPYISEIEVLEILYFRQLIMMISQDYWSRTDCFYL